MISKLSFFLIIVFSIIIVIGYFINEAEANHHVWAGGEKGTRLVQVNYVDEVFCNNEKEIHTKGCYNPNTDEITVKIGYENSWVPRGCTVLQHEQGHAFGLNEAQLEILNCPNPSINTNAGQYQEDNIHHWDPLYEHKPFNSQKIGFFGWK